MRDACIEPDTGEIEEQPALDLARVDHPIASAERDVEGHLRIEGDADLAGESVAGPARNDRTDAGVNASAEATSFTVPSPPHATHSVTPRPSAASASSRA